MSLGAGDVYLFLDSINAWADAQTGQEIATSAIQAEIQAHIAAGQALIQELTGQMSAGDITLEEWKLAIASELKDMHGAMAMLGAGGADNMTPAMWGEVGSRLKQEYIYLNNFAQEIADGKLSEAQIAMRLDMYTNGAYGSYADAERTSEMLAGSTEEMRILEDGADHCGDCEDAAGHWEPIGTLPDIGDSQCGSNCQCSFDYQ